MAHGISLSLRPFYNKLAIRKGQQARKNRPLSIAGCKLQIDPKWLYKQVS